MDDEIEIIELTTLHKTRKFIVIKWVYKTKIDEDGKSRSTRPDSQQKAIVNEKEPTLKKYSHQDQHHPTHHYIGSIELKIYRMVVKSASSIAIQKKFTLSKHLVRERRKQILQVEEGIIWFEAGTQCLKYQNRYVLPGEWIPRESV